MVDNEFLTTFFDSMPVPAYAVDSELKFLYFNEAALQTIDMVGYDRTQLIGRHLREALPFFPPELEDRFRHVLKTGETVVDDRQYEIGGKTYSVEATRFPIRRDGKITIVGVIYRDVTDLRQMHEQLKTSEETARALMNSSTESMFLVGEDERLIVANTTSAERLGIPIEQLESMTIYQMMPPEVAENRLKQFRYVRDSGNPVRFTDERMGRTFDITMFPVPSKTGAPRRVAIYARDVTEKEGMIRALSASEKRFRELFDRTPVPTYVWRWDGSTLVLREANRAAEQLTEGKVTGWFGSTVEQMYAKKYPDVVADIRNCYLQKLHIVRELQYRLISIDKEGYFEVHYVFVAPDEVMIHTVDLTARREAEVELQRSHTELEKRVNARTSELAELNDQLRLEREALNQKNAAMRELISHINDNRSDMAHNIQANLQHVVTPILDRLQSRLDDNNGTYVRMLRESLDDLLSPHIAGLHVHHPHLTAHEVELCNLIRSGLTCKEIAELRGRSEQTILKQRKVIRKKLGLTDNRINLRNYLASGKSAG